MVSRILREAKLSRAKDLEPAAVVRYERAAAGELIHLAHRRRSGFGTGPNFRNWRNADFTVQP